MEFVSQQIQGFTDSDIPDEYLEWDPLVTYIKEPYTLSNASVVKYGNYYYRSITNNNSGYNPEEYLHIEWMILKVSNMHAMLDLQSQTSTVVLANSFYVEFTKNSLMDTIGLGYINCSKITVQHYDELGDVIPEVTQVINYSVDDFITDYWSYMYADYSYVGNTSQLIKTPPVGVKVRITFEHSLPKISVGYLIAGEAVNMGTSQYGVKFGYNSYAKREIDDYGRLRITKRAVQNITDFETDIPNSYTMYVRNRTAEIYDDVVLFIVDESPTSLYQNILTLGVIQNADLVVSYPTFSVMSWSIIETI